MTRSDRDAMRGEPLRVGVLGATGQLGTCLVRELEGAADLELAFATKRTDIDMTDLDGLDAWLDDRLEGPVDLIVNATAHTKVDACEDEAELAYQVNALAPAAWAKTLAARGVRFIHVSTDYVFAGNGSRPYREDDPTEPRTVYGASKRAGEVAVLGTDPRAVVVRTSWVFGPGRNFVRAILDQAAKRVRGEAEGPLRVVDDQHGSPTYAAHLARALLELGRGASDGLANASGILHLRNAGETTWYGFAREILDRAGYPEIEIVPVPTSAFETRAPRPAYSVLDCGRAASLGLELPHWSEGLAGYLSGPDRPEDLIRDADPRGGRSASASPRREVSQ